MALTSTGSRDCLVPPFTTQQVRYTSATDVPPEYPAGPGGVFTSEAGGAATLFCSLSAPVPNGTVVAFSVSVTDPSEATVVTGQVIAFTAANWDINTSVTIVGAPDDFMDGDVPYQVEFTPISSASRGVADRVSGKTGDLELGGVGEQLSADDMWSGVSGVSIPMVRRNSDLSLPRAS